MRHALKIRRVAAGYTLTEMLVVVAIIGLIAAVVTPGLVGQLTRAKAKAASLQLQSTAAAVESFASDVGRYPTSAEGLDALLRPPAGLDAWTGPYLSDDRALVDPWNRPLVYEADAGGGRFLVKTLGADGKEGGGGADRDQTAPRRP